MRGRGRLGGLRWLAAPPSPARRWFGLVAVSGGGGGRPSAPGPVIVVPPLPPPFCPRRKHTPRSFRAPTLDGLRAEPLPRPIQKEPRRVRRAIDVNLPEQRRRKTCAKGASQATSAAGDLVDAASGVLRPQQPVDG